MKAFNKKLSLILAIVILAGTALYLGSTGLASVGLLQSAKATETLSSQMNFAIPTASGGFVNLGAEIKGQILADGTLQVTEVTPNTMSEADLTAVATYMQQTGKPDLNSFFSMKSADFGGKVLSKQVAVLQVQNPTIKKVKINKALVKKQPLAIQSVGNPSQKTSKATIQKVAVPKQVLKVASLLIPQAYAQDNSWWDSFTGWLGDAWDSVTDYFSDAWDAAQNWWNDMTWENFGDIFTGTSPEDERAADEWETSQMLPDSYVAIGGETFTKNPDGTFTSTNGRTMSASDMYIFWKDDLKENWTFDYVTGEYRNQVTGHTLDQDAYNDLFNSPSPWLPATDPNEGQYWSAPDNAWKDLPETNYGNQDMWQFNAQTGKYDQIFTGETIDVETYNAAFGFSYDSHYGQYWSAPDNAWRDLPSTDTPPTAPPTNTTGNQTNFGDGYDSTSDTCVEIGDCSWSYDASTDTMVNQDGEFMDREAWENYYSTYHDAQDYQDYMESLANTDWSKPSTWTDLQAGTPEFEAFSNYAKSYFSASDWSNFENATSLPNTGFSNDPEYSAASRRGFSTQPGDPWYQGYTQQGFNYEGLPYGQETMPPRSDNYNDPNTNWDSMFGF